MSKSTLTEIQSFFKRHHAVPATDAGPQWDRATTEALDGQLKTMIEACNRDADRRQRAFDGLRKDMAAVARELLKRTDTTYDRNDLRGIVELCDPRH